MYHRLRGGGGVYSEGQKALMSRKVMRQELSEKNVTWHRFVARQVPAGAAVILQRSSKPIELCHQVSLLLPPRAACMVAHFVSPPKHEAVPKFSSREFLPKQHPFWI